VKILDQPLEGSRDRSPRIIDFILCLILRQSGWDQGSALWLSQNFKVLSNINSVHTSLHSGRTRQRKRLHDAQPWHSTLPESARDDEDTHIL